MSLNLRDCMKRQSPRRTRKLHRLDAFTGAKKASTVRQHKWDFPPGVEYFEDTLASSRCSFDEAWDKPLRDDMLPDLSMSPVSCTL
jgi:hypothetical protein